MNEEMMSSLGTWGPILLMVLIFYFLLYRPQKKAQSKRRNMLEALKRGTRIITVGGIYGTIISIDDTIVRLEISKGIVIDCSRNSIASIVTDELKKEPEEKSEDSSDA